MQHTIRQQARRRAKGFSLIEIMIVVAVIAIIAAIALPSYNNSVLKSKRGMGKAELMEVLSMQEQYFINNKAYATDLTSLGYATNPYFINDQGSEVADANSIYRIALSGATVSDFTIEALARNGQADDTDCSTLTLTNTGAKTPAQCW